MSQPPPPSLQASPSLKWARATKGKARPRRRTHPPYSFTEAQEEAIACWVKSKKLLYDIKDKQYKEKALKRHLWEGKAAEYRLDCKYKKIYISITLKYLKSISDT